MPNELAADAGHASDAADAGHASDAADAGHASDAAASDAAPDGATPPEDTARAIPITLAMASEITAQRFQNQGPMDFTVLVDGLVENPARVGEKDGPCFIPGALIDDSKPANKRDSNRTAKNLASLSMMVFDLDAGQDIDSVITALEANGYAALLYASHNDEATATKIEGRDEYIRAAKAAGEDVESIAFAAAYLTERRKLTPEMAATIRGVEDTAKAIVIIHAPSSRFRVIMPLTDPFVFSAKGVVHADQQALWKRYYAAVANALGFFCDVACKDVARGFYLPSRPPKTRDRRAIYVAGRGLDLAEFEIPAIEERRETKKAAGGEKIFAEIGDRKIDLARFWASGGKSLNLASVLEAYDSEPDTHRRGGSGLNCACPFEDEHPKQDNRFWCMDAQDSDNGNFQLKCQHSTCASRDKFEFVRGFIELGRLPLEALGDEANYALEEGVDFSGVLAALGIDPRGPMPERLLPAEVEVSNPFSEPKEAMDIIAGTKKAALIAMATELARRFGVIAGLSEGEEDVFVCALNAATGLPKNGIRKEMERGRPQKNPEFVAWLKAGEQQAEKESAASLNTELAKFNERFAVVPVGSSTRIMETPKDVTAKPSYRTADDFRLLHGNQYAQCGDDFVSVAKEWLNWEGRLTYYGGVVFEPEGAPDDAYNLWRGFAVTSAPGSWAKLRGHIEKNVCGGDPDLFNWVMTWLAHPIQHPGKKMGSALILRGAKGSGKSKTLDWYRKLFGVHGLKIAKRNQLVGQFNKHLGDLLFLQVEEATWGGDAEADGVLKDLITGEDIAIEAKFVDVVNVSSYVRIGMTANPKWVVPATLGDERRWCVIDVGGDWVIDPNDEEQAKARLEFFQAIDEEMEAGGLAAMMLELESWTPANGDWNVLRRPPRTAGLIKQGLQSLSTEERFILRLIADGEISFPGADAPAPIEFEKHGSGYWYLNAPLLRDNFEAWMLKSPKGRYHAHNEEVIYDLAREWAGWNGVRHNIRIAGKQTWVLEVEAPQVCRSRLLAKGLGDYMTFGAGDEAEV